MVIILVHLPNGKSSLYLQVPSDTLYFFLLKFAVMQFGGQHRGGIPAVGMAFPGYVGQPQLGLGNSEMTW